MEDLLRHFPARYEDLSKIYKIKDLILDEVATIKGEIIKDKIKNKVIYRPRGAIFILEATIQDETGEIKAVWFNQPYLANAIQKEGEFFLSGKVKKKDNEIYFNSPEVEATSDKKEPTHTAKIIPIYPETRGVSSKWLRYAISKILPEAVNLIQDALPQEILKEDGLPNIQDAFLQIHNPKSLTSALKAKERFSFEEILTLRLAALSVKEKLKNNNAPKIATDIKRTKEFVDSLPFELTTSQKKTSWTILKDLESPSPMNRLLEGDTGSGKTIIAAISALNVIKAGYQVAFMAPTELLAKQHYENIKELFKNQKINIALTTRLSKNIPEGTDMFIGTHALIQESVEIQNLGLAIIDEQHRFGVAQRASLIKREENNSCPHLLSMTATPIPRTLALTIYGDLDISLLLETPKGRKKVKTEFALEKDRKKKIEFIRSLLKKGQQAFIVTPLIEESRSIKVKNALDEYEKLARGEFKDYKVGLLHGRMKQAEKEKTMREFKENNIQVLVSTSIVGVGIDIENATVIMIEGAERFGLAQLHQFRGRVGRSDKQSYCFLFSSSKSEAVSLRMKAIEKAESGFKLAEYDLNMRGYGEIYGSKQSGLSSIATDALSRPIFIEKISYIAENLIKKDPGLKTSPELLKNVKRIEETLHFE